MTKKIEVLDALPGCGKTYAITKYMAENRERPWLYLSPLASEVYPDEKNQDDPSCTNVVDRAGELGLQLFVPIDDSDSTKSKQVLEFLEEGLDIACTHNLMLRFTRKHIEAIKRHKYNVVCDETLDLLAAYSIEKDDFDFLKEQNLISVDPVVGRVSFKDVDMGDKARYSDVKLLCDLGCLFAAPRSERMLVTQLSTDLMKECNRFILITYNYDGSLMHQFLNLHGFSYEIFNEVKLRYDSNEAKKKIAALLNIIETRSVLEVQRGLQNKLSKSWWNNASKEAKDAVFKAIASCIKKSKATKKTDYIFTCPKDVIEPKTVKGYKPSTRYVSRDSWLACNCRATNEYASAKLAIQAYNLYPNVAVVSYLRDMGCEVNQESYALNMLIQWLWRGCIRNGEPMDVVLLSNRMSVIFKYWLTKADLVA